MKARPQPAAAQPAPDEPSVAGREALDEDRRRPGRPRTGERGLYAVLSVRVTEREFDKLYQLARRHEQSVSTLARRILVERLKL